MKFFYGLVVMFFCSFLSKDVYTVFWESKVKVNSDEISYRIIEGDTKEQSVLQINGKDIIQKNLIQYLKEAENKISLHNCGRVLCAPCMCFFSLLGIIPSCFEKRKIRKFRNLLEAAYEDNIEILEDFKSNIIEYLNQIASGQKIISELYKLSDVQVLRWKNISLDEIKSYFKKINISGTAFFTRDQEDDIDIEIIQCCCISTSEAPYNVDQENFFTELLVISNFLDSSYEKNFEGLILSRLDSKIENYLIREALRDNIRSVASLCASQG